MTTAMMQAPRPIGALIKRRVFLRHPRPNHRQHNDTESRTCAVIALLNCEESTWPQTWHFRPMCRWVPVSFLLSPDLAGKHAARLKSCVDVSLVLLQAFLFNKCDTACVFILLPQIVLHSRLLHAPFILSSNPFLCCLLSSLAPSLSNSSFSFFHPSSSSLLSDLTPQCHCHRHRVLLFLPPSVSLR